MTLAELLRMLRGPILNDRTSLVQGASDYLWTDEELVTFINEAQRRFAVRSLIIRDGSTPAITQITLVAGQTEYELHSSIMSVISARVSTQPTDLRRVGHSILSAYTPPTENWVDPATYFGRAPGPTLAYGTDEEVGADGGGSMSNVMLRVYPVPRTEEAGTIIQLRVARKPARIFTVADINDPTAVPELPVDHHLEMLDWAAYLALRIVDDDAGSPARATEFAQSFEAHVQAAKMTAMRKMFAPMGWGFGRGGFSWSNC